MICARSGKEWILRAILSAAVLVPAPCLAASSSAASVQPPSIAAAPVTHMIPLCRETLAALPAGRADPDPYLAAAACLRSPDSLRAPRDRKAMADSILKARLPADMNWFLAQLEKFRANRDAPRALGMAYLAGLKHPADPATFRELAEVYQMIPDPYLAGLAYLRVADLDSLQAGYVQYQLENLLRTAATEAPPAVLLDSLTAGYAHTRARTAEMLETLCWGNRDYPAAYRNFLSLSALQNPGPGAALDRVNRFQSLGYFDYASAILEKMAWRGLPQPWLSMARAQYMQIAYQLKDWTAVAAEAQVTSGVRSVALTDEESFIIATAQLRLGKPDQAMSRLKPLAEQAAPPWGYRARLLRAQALMSLRDPKGAAETLDALKRDPHRQEGTGPILFWQGCLALQQDRYAAAESLMVLASAYTGNEEAQRALEYRFFLLQDTGIARTHFFRGLPESPFPSDQRMRALDGVDHGSALWPYARIEKAQILVQTGRPDSAEAVLDDAAKRSPDRLAGLQAEAKAAFLQEKLPGGRQAALARYEDLLIKYQQGVIPEFSRGRIKALK